MRTNDYTINPRKKTIERRWQYLSADSWITLFNQIIKIYIVNRITEKSLIGIPGVDRDRCQVDSTMRKSNIYSVSEIILLKWATYHFTQLNLLNATNKKFINFDQDFADGNAFAALLQNHCEPTSSTLHNMRPRCSGLQHRQQNMNLVLKQMREL
jgi:hypothetical protein